jgi:hypothetical protein
MKDFMDNMLRMQENNMTSTNVHGGAFDKQGGRQSDIYGHSNMQMQQIGNVFYNLLNMVGSQNKDERMIGLSNNLREMIQSRTFNNLFDNNVPYAGFEKVNLLKTHDLSIRDQANLIKNGLGDLLHHPTAQLMSSSIIQNKLDLDIEAKDSNRASQF